MIRTTCFLTALLTMSALPGGASAYDPQVYSAANWGEGVYRATVDGRFCSFGVAALTVTGHGDTATLAFAYRDYSDPAGPCAPQAEPPVRAVTYEDCVFSAWQLKCAAAYWEACVFHEHDLEIAGGKLAWRQTHQECAHDGQEEVDTNEWLWADVVWTLVAPA